MTELKINPTLRDLIPPLSDYELEALEVEIRHWARAYSPIITWNGTIVDGHHRYEICRKHDLPFKVEEKAFNDQVEAEIWILNNQRARRNLPTYVLAEIGFEIEKRQESKRGKRKDLQNKNFTSVPCGTEVQDSQEWPTRKAAKASGMGHNTYAKCKYIHKHGTEEQKEALRKRKTTPNKVFADLKREMVREETIAKLEAIETKQSKAIYGVYDVIVIDPPWPIKNIEMDVRPNEVEFDYPTMTLQEIEEIVIPSAEDCHVFLWTTQKFLPEAFKIIQSWSFRYVCTFVWHKDRSSGFKPIGLPKYNCEFVLYARKGKPRFIDEHNFFTCFEGKRGKHSEKPEEFYALLRRVTAGRRLDMFNRRKIEEFDGWGNECTT